MKFPCSKEIKLTANKNRLSCHPLLVNNKATDLIVTGSMLRNYRDFCGWEVKSMHSQVNGHLPWRSLPRSSFKFRHETWGIADVMEVLWEHSWVRSLHKPFQSGQYHKSKYLKKKEQRPPARDKTNLMSLITSLNISTHNWQVWLTGTEICIQQTNENYFFEKYKFFII